MWNADKSLMLSIISVKLFFVIGIIFFIAGYPIASAYVEYIHQPSTFYPILITGYLCLALAFFILRHLYKLLNNIRQDQIFTNINIAILRSISWECMAVACICAIASIGYMSFLLVSIVFAFIALIIRVVKNVIAQAKLMKEENDYTI